MDNAILMPFLGSLIGGALTVVVAYFTLRRDRQKQERDFAEQRASQERQFTQERARQEREFSERLATNEASAKQERETLGNAIQAELERVQSVVKRQRQYLWDDERKGVRPGFEKTPLNWAAIQTPVWDSVVALGKVGLLPPGDAKDLTWFFGYVRWMNTDLLPQYSFYKEEKRLAEFVRFVARAYETLIAGGWRPQEIAPPVLSPELDGEPPVPAETKVLGPKKETE